MKRKIKRLNRLTSTENITYKERLSIIYNQLATLFPGQANRKYRAGFTLIEIMIVVVILGILISIVAPRLRGRTQKAKIAAAKTTIEGNLALALDLYELDNGDYPPGEQGLEALSKAPSNASNWKGPYLKKRVPLDPWKNAYVYLCPGTHNPEDYDLYSYGPDGVAGGGDDITNWDDAEQQ